MDQPQEQVRTDIEEERAEAPEKRRLRRWLFIGIGASLAMVAIGMLYTAVRPHKQQLPGPTAEDQEQLKYDSAQNQREQLKASTLRDDPFLVRKDDNSQSQLGSLLKDLNVEKQQAAELPTPATDKQAKAEEEAISHVLRDPSPPPAAAPIRSAPPRPAATASSQQETSSDAEVRAMFVYSRTFGGAKFVDAPQKQAAQRTSAPTAEQQAEPKVSSTKVSSSSAAKTESSAEEKPADQITILLYTDLPPVTLREGEMLEAVLVNRIIADTEASPVVCSLARDFFDRSAKYVVFPANSRIVGTSQVVNYKGSHRLFISFSRIILPSGASLDLPSSRKALKALDDTGAAGVVSNVERHWFLQFGSAIFLGALDGLAGAAQRNQDVFATSSIVLGRTSQNFDHILENIMAQYSTIVPTIRVDQGKKMLVYLSDDVLISPYAKVSDRSYAKR